VPLTLRVDGTVFLLKNKEAEEIKKKFEEAGAVIELK